ncbi:MAG: hypothetical protein ACI9RU_000767 [Litorivivens sp.]|jgi:hypothetical protein
MGKEGCLFNETNQGGNEHSCTTIRKVELHDYKVFK